MAQVPTVKKTNAPALNTSTPRKYKPVMSSSNTSYFNVVTPSSSTTMITPTTAQHLYQQIAQQQHLLVQQIQNGTNSITNPFAPTIALSTYANNIMLYQHPDDDMDFNPDRDLILNDGEEYNILLPDGSRLEVKTDGSFELVDANAKITYRANRMRNFNPFLNASDKLEEFIRFCGSVGVRQSEVLRLPMELFVSWLIIEAARADGEPEPTDIPLLPGLKRQALPRCTGCGRFLSRLKRAKKLDYCAPRCFETHYVRALA